MVLCRKFRPERLTFHHHQQGCCPNAAAAAVAAVTCAQEARLAESNSSATLLNQQRGIHLVSGGFANFSAAYPQYCESKCPAASGADVVDGRCHQQPQRQYLVEPNYNTNQGPTQLLSFVYVGSQTDACDADVIRRHGITHVLNVSANCPQSEHVDQENFMRVPVNDGYADKLLPHFKQAFQFLDNVRRSNGRCLVHCLAGISRSPTMAIAYIMQHLAMSQDDAYRYVKARRPSISPNFNFLGQLLEFERQLQQQQQQQSTASAAAASRSSNSSEDSEAAADSACSEAKRQKRFYFALPESETSSAEQQQQQHPPRRCSSAPKKRPLSGSNVGPDEAKLAAKPSNAATAATQALTMPASTA